MQYNVISKNLFTMVLVHIRVSMLTCTSPLASEELNHWDQQKQILNVFLFSFIRGMDLQNLF